MGLNMRALDANTGGGWTCYFCRKPKDRVVYLDHLRDPDRETSYDQERFVFMCPECLANEVENGHIVIVKDGVQGDPGIRDGWACETEASDFCTYQISKDTDAIRFENLPSDNEYAETLYLCPECLWLYVQSGVLLVQLPQSPGQTNAFDPVVEDDGSISIDGFSVQWR